PPLGPLFEARARADARGDQGADGPIRGGQDQTADLGSRTAGRGAQGARDGGRRQEHRQGHPHDLRGLASTLSAVVLLSVCTSNTFHVRHRATFSNGDAITADDFIYSWNRAAAKQGDSAGVFSVVAGYSAVGSGRTGTLSGLVKVDDYIFTSTLNKRAGYWPTLVGLWPFWVVDRKVIAAAGEDAWFTKPETLIGSGPFRLTARATGQSLDFEPVPAWCGGKTGARERIHLDVLSDHPAQVSRYESGGYSLIGSGRQ